MKLKLTSLVFLFWFTFVVKESFTYLFFKSNPKYGTLFSSGIELFIVYLLLIIVLYGKKVPNIALGNAGLVWLILLFSIYQGFSLTWANSSSFFTSFSYWVISFGEIFIVLVYSKLIPPVILIESSLKGYIHGALLLSFIALTGQTPDGRLGDDTFLHPNVIGNIFAISAICCLYSIMVSKRKKYFSLLFVYFIGILFTTLSKSAIVAFLISIVVFMFLSKIKFRYKFVSLLTFSGIILLFYSKLYAYWEEYTSVGGGKLLTTFTGRTIIWDLVRLKIKEHPILGYGFFSFRDYGPQPFEIEIGSAHNEFLNVWFNFGLIGLTFYVVIFLLYLIKTFRTKEKDLRIFSLLLFVYFMIRGISEGHPTSIMFIMPLLLVISICLSATQKTNPFK